MITLDFVRAGNAIFTVTGKTGDHYTYRSRAGKPTAAWPDPATFISLLNGPENTRDYVYVGVLTREGGIRLTRKSKLPADALPVRVLIRALATIRGDRPLPEGWSIEHAGRCGHCGRLLTTPESLKAGLGPECAAKLGQAWGRKPRPVVEGVHS